MFACASTAIMLGAVQLNSHPTVSIRVPFISLVKLSKIKIGPVQEATRPSIMNYVLIEFYNCAKKVFYLIMSQLIYTEVQSDASDPFWLNFIIVTTNILIGV